MIQYLLAVTVFCFVMLLVALSAYLTIRRKRRIAVRKKNMSTQKPPEEHHFETVQQSSSKHSKSSSDSNDSPDDASLQLDEVSDHEGNSSRNKDNLEEDKGNDQAKTEHEDDSDYAEEGIKTSYNLGDVLNNQYKIQRVMGEGAYGKVVKALDMESLQNVAIKIVVNAANHPSSQNEIKAFHKLKEVDPRGAYLWCNMLGTFTIKKDLFLVFELLSYSMHSFQKQNRYAPYMIEHIRHIAFQICHSVAFLHKNRIAHTDIKPDNILFINVDSEECRLETAHIKLIDFGCAQFEDEGFKGVISTCYYRAPEVILRLGWSYPADVWSIGCTLYEAYTGYPLFMEHNKSRIHLAMMNIVLGPIPQQMRKNRRKKRHPFFIDNQLVLTQKDTEKLKHYAPLAESFKPSKPDLQLLALIQDMLVYLPEKRVTCDAAIRHPFFDELPDILKPTAT